jgi:hypothetical protein
MISSHTAFEKRRRKGERAWGVLDVLLKKEGEPCDVGKWFQVTSPSGEKRKMQK